MNGAPSAYERFTLAVMVVVFAALAAVTWPLLSTDSMWTDPVRTPVLALFLAWLVLVPLMLLWYWRHRLEPPAEPGAGDVDARLRWRCRKELYWWVGEGPLLSSVVVLIFGSACIGVSTVAHLSSGAPAARALVPLFIFGSAMIVAAPLAVLRVKWLRRRLQDDSPEV